MPQKHVIKKLKNDIYGIVILFININKTLYPMNQLTTNSVSNSLGTIKEKSSTLISKLVSNFEEPIRKENNTNSDLSAQDLFSMFTADIIKSKVLFSR